MLLFAGGSTAQTEESVTPRLATVSLSFVPVPTPPDYTNQILVPLHQHQDATQAACQAAGGVLSGVTCNVPPPPPPPAPVAPSAASRSDVPGSAPVTETSYGLTVGVLGYSLAGGNCVDEPGVNNPGWGNPIDWPVTSYTPWIGATVLFWFNHTAVVSGIYPNGDIEVRQENCPACPTRFSPAQIRGYR